jgi:transcriptional regulator with XRE-family HTH domain
MNKILGNRLKELRGAKGYTQEQIAERIGISRQKYARIESGVNNITLEILTKIAQILDVTIRDITHVLEEKPLVEYRGSFKNTSADEIFDMVNILYANKHLYEKLHHNQEL